MYLESRRRFWTCGSVQQSSKFVFIHSVHLLHDRKETLSEALGCLVDEGIWYLVRALSSIFDIRIYDLSVMDLFHCEPIRYRSEVRLLGYLFLLLFGGFGGSLGGGKPYNIISLTLIRTFPSSFLPVPFAPHPQNKSAELFDGVFCERRFSI